MNKEELLENTSILDDKDIFEKLDKNKELRDWFLVELNVSLQRTESVVANLKDKKELRCYKNAVMSLEIENQKYKEVIEKIDKYINDYNVFEVFSFPLMKRWEEEQVKSSIDYEFKTSLIKDLKDILKEVE